MHLEEMFPAHPNRQDLAYETIPACVTAALDCSASCLTCADACLAQPEVEALVGCIRLNLDCAAICRAAAEVLSRSNNPDWLVIRALLEATARATSACARVCEQHAVRMEHCRVCAETCRETATLLRRLLAQIPDIL
jgi:hypothetical protein